MKRIRIEICLLTILLLFTFCACNAPSDDTPSGTEPTTVATTTETPTTAATTAPTPSQAVSLFTLLSDINYNVYNTPTEPLAPGPTPLDYLPPKNEALIGKELTVNLTTEQAPVYFYYCKNAEAQTERMAFILADEISQSAIRIRYPLLIVADVTLGGIDGLKAALENGTDFNIKIVDTVNISSEEGGGMLPATFAQANLPSASVPYVDGMVEYCGRAGGNDATVIIPRVANKNAFHTTFDRFSLNEIMGIYTEE